MTTFTVPSTLCAANAETDSPGQAMPAGTPTTQYTVELTSVDWSNPALAGQKVLWGLAYSLDNGVTWGPGICDNTSSNTVGGSSVNVPSWAYATQTVGQSNPRTGKIGLLQFTTQNAPPAGALVRLFAWPTVAIHLGATITIT